MALPEPIRLLPEAPGLFFSPTEYDVAAAFLSGYNLAVGGSLLRGFDEWLVVRVGFGNNLSWPALVLRLTFPRSQSPREQLQEPGMQELAVKSLLALLIEFTEEKESPRGLFRILLKHQRWLESQDWYGPSSPDYLDEQR